MREHLPGMRIKIVRIEQPDPDHYAVIHLEGGSAFGCGQSWFDEQQPAVGRYVDVDPQTQRRIVVD
jgi:hypothetical protein